MLQIELRKLTTVNNIKHLDRAYLGPERLLCVECSTDATVKVADYLYCNKHAARALRDNLALLLNKAYNRT
jgi:hypothetical protein